MTAIGVLCARVRVEEKQIIAALADAGVVAMAVPPASAPLPPGLASADGATLGNQRHDGDDVVRHHELRLIVDRCQNRHVAAATLPLLKLSGIEVLDAGLAATGSRLEIATAFAQANLPRPQAFVGFSEASAMEAAARLGFPATLMPQTPGSATTSLLDHDTAEAVIEHRVVLGSHGEAIVLLQAGAPQAEHTGRHHVVVGEVIAVEGALVDGEAQELAVAAAQALGARFIAVDVARIDGQLVIWDVAPVADFRQATLTGSRGVGNAIADVVRSTTGGLVSALGRSDVSIAVAQNGWEVQVRHGVIGVSLTA
ncbi:MAG: hypothetical protein M3412_07415 [Chloroflexota bacterium]|nr:hypothetical protein [Chloroflexota bacterium]